MDKNINDHITQYLNYYLALNVPPKYAVLLRGEWGAGKSWFLNSYMNNIGEDKFLYVSLNGVTSFREIEENFFQQLHPILSSKGMKIAGQIIKGLIKTTIKVDFDGNGKEDGSVTSAIPDINIPEYLKKVDERILIFDDLERCAIAIPNVLGYINQFVENNNLKVIVIANENEIIKRDKLNKEEDSTKAYQTVKEKLIGKSFDVQPDFKNAIEDFINQVGNRDAQKLLKAKISLLQEIFNSAGYNNLRHLRLSILDFERFYDLLPKSSENKDELLEHIISLFFSISFEIKKGLITEDSLPQLFQLDNLIRKDTKKKDVTDSIRSKYTVLGYVHQPIGYGLWKDYFKFGILDKEELKQSIESSKYYKSSSTPDWIRLWHFYELNDNEFKDLFEKVFKQFVALKIEDKHVLIQLVGMFITFSELNLIQQTKKIIIEVAEANVEALKKEGKLKVGKHDLFPFESSHGLKYQGINIKEVQGFLNYIADQVNVAAYGDYPKIAEELLLTLSKSVDEFEEKITVTNSVNNIYYDVPILGHIPPPKFVDTFMKLSNKDKQKLSWALEKRYNVIDFNSKLKDEYKWLKKVAALLAKEKDEKKGEISGFIIESLVLASLTKSLNALDTSIKFGK